VLLKWAAGVRRAAIHVLANTRRGKISGPSRGVAIRHVGDIRRVGAPTPAVTRPRYVELNDRVERVTSGTRLRRRA